MSKETAYKLVPIDEHLSVQEGKKEEDAEETTARRPRCFPTCCCQFIALPIVLISFGVGVTAVSYLIYATTPLSDVCSWWTPAMAILTLLVIVGPVIGIAALLLPAAASFLAKKGKQCNTRGVCCTSGVLCAISIILTIGSAIVVAVLAGFVLYLTTGSELPTHVNGLIDQVRIEYDSDGVPHIYARNEHDAFVAVGMVQAKDRLWQMEFERRAGHGTLCEIVGGGALESDKLSRTLGFTEAATRAYNAIDDRTREALLAYSEGVNAYLDSNPNLPLEFIVFWYKPAHWAPIDSLVWETMLNFELSCNVDAEIIRWRFLTERGLSYQRVSQLYPTYNRTEHITVLDIDEFLGPVGVAQPVSINDSQEIIDFVNSYRGSDMVDKKPYDNSGLGDWLIVPPYDFLPLRRGPSNNYVISPPLTESGSAPLLANDPHLLLTMPGVWYAMHINVADTKINVIGVGFVGMPAVIIGRNDKIAWGVTTAAIDVEDLYLLNVKPIPNTNPIEYGYVYDDGVLPFIKREEVIEISGGESYALTILLTQNGMPVIREPLILETDPCVLALRWSGIDPAVPDTTPQSFVGLMLAQNWDDFKKTLSYFIGPIHNFVFASVDGDIGYIAPGWVPRRMPGVSGQWPVPGNTSKYVWNTDPIPYDMLPMSKNPTKGYIATANNMITPVGYEATGWVLNGEFLPGYRAQRIVDLIDEYVSTGRRITVGYMKTIQLDDMSYQFHSLVDVLRNMSVDVLTDEALQWRSALLAWDGNSVIGVEEPAMFNSWVLELQRMDEKETGLPQWGEWATAWYHVRAALVGQEYDPGCGGGPSCATFAAKALNAAVTRMSGRGLSWGEDVHKAIFENYVMGNASDIVACAYERMVPKGGDCHTVDAGCPGDTAEMEMVSGPSYRQVVDLSDMDGNSFYIVPPGQNEEPLMKHYDDQLGRYSAGEYVRMTTTDYTVESTVLLSP